MITTSTAASRLLTICTMSPDRPAQPCVVADGWWCRPGGSARRWPRRLATRSCGTSALTVSASSWNVRPATPGGRDDGGRALQRHADEAHASRRPDELLMPYGGNSVLPVACRRRWPTRNLKFAPSNGTGVHDGGPCRSSASLGWQPPFCMRSSSAAPLSNSWLPTALKSSADVVHRLDSGLVEEQRGDQRRRADQVAGRHDRVVRVLRLQRRDGRGHVGRTAGRHRDVPPAAAGAVIDSLGGSRLPCRSLKAMSLTSTLAGVLGVVGLAGGGRRKSRHRRCRRRRRAEGGCEGAGERGVLQRDVHEGPLPGLNVDEAHARKRL